MLPDAALVPLHSINVDLRFHTSDAILNIDSMIVELNNQTLQLAEYSIRLGSHTARPILKHESKNHQDPTDEKLAEVSSKNIH